MDGFRRTIPRSARRGPPKRETLDPVNTTPQLSVTPKTHTPGASGGRYVPNFQGSATKSEVLTQLPAIRTGVEAIYPSKEPVIVYTPAPLTCVRWLPYGGRAAIAAVGSGDGGYDSVSLYGVTSESTGVHCQLEREIDHNGKVYKIGISELDGSMFTASSDGWVRCMAEGKWEDENEGLQDVVRLSEVCGREEGVVGVAIVGQSVVAAGEHGSLCVADVESGETWGRQFDDVGFHDVVAVDGNGSQVVTAGGCEVAVWDIRTGSSAGLRHPTTVPAMSVAVDKGQPHFIMAGLRNGEVCVWDRRGVESYPVNRMQLHEGPVWDVGVVSSSKAGLLLCCGEDGMVWLVDFAAAGYRGGIGSAERSWYDRGEFWRAQVKQSDLRNVVGSNDVLGINSVNSHASADLFSYTSDSGSVAFGCLYG